MTSFQALWRHPQYRAGARDMAPISLGIAAWGLVTGVAIVKAGLPVGLALAMTFLVYAGSAQLAAVPLMAAGAPLLVIWATAFCVNLRFVIFSAQWRPFFRRFPRRQRLVLGYFTGDLSYVLFMKRFREPNEHEGQIEYFLGGASVNWLSWQSASVAGILLADVVPTAWGLGFAGVLALIGLVCSLLSDRATVLAGVVAAGAAVAAFALPFKLNILVAIAAAVCVGLIVEGGGGDTGRRIRERLLRAAQRLGPAGVTSRDREAAA
ncbi:AzlC family ABC transporter permease [Piscinibacter sakaiensis]|uniref:Branched-chain amino acid transport protein azlC n=1 Tax=Piscinibacter sakaiensis TaxID=1547922 RepID=A0A0K8P549_PISS1|nr:AzlC family ABC transporter permease [Piscinibacter sakaiensis]GAP37767.1 branched-chain amino acid transport protein azlC [Piscinibacter sakaiensis]